MIYGSLNRLASSATTHCLTGCAIGEVLGLIIADALGWGSLASITPAVVLAFFFGYLLTLLRSGLALATAFSLAFASDTLSITVIEIVDNLIVLLIPGAMDSGPLNLLFWGSLAVALAIAFVATFPVRRYLISRGKGHAVVMSSTTRNTITTTKSTAIAASTSTFYMGTLWEIPLRGPGGALR
jgi:Domain of unknown function (DUF4396)